MYTVDALLNRASKKDYEIFSRWLKNNPNTSDAVQLNWILSNPNIAERTKKKLVWDIYMEDEDLRREKEVLETLGEPLEKFSQNMEALSVSMTKDCHKRVRDLILSMIGCILVYIAASIYGDMFSGTIENNIVNFVAMMSFGLALAMLFRAYGVYQRFKGGDVKKEAASIKDAIAGRNLRDRLARIKENEEIFCELLMVIVSNHMDNFEETPE